MSLNKDNQEKLENIKRQLPDISVSIDLSDNYIKTDNNSKKKHRIETTKDPKLLFKELIKASPDGKIPRHLIERLKFLEEEQIGIDLDNNSFKTKSSKHNKAKNQQFSETEENLYIAFKRLLLEEE
tara:strand:- start:2269 stop:2646 length:378 start_codon:yes stop_codon:yes gene_type:complete